VLERGQFVLGPNVAALERELGAYLQVAHAVALASGTDALHLALRACGIGAGDAVLTTPFTFVATATAISYVGARPVFADIRPDTFTLDPDRVRDILAGRGPGPSLPGRIRALIPVHLYGQPADMPAINEIAARFELAVVEDAAQSLGAEVRGRRAGSLGRTACFSFYPTKNLGAYGDAGLVTTADAQLYDRLHALRQHGCTHDKYHHDVVGWNSRLDELQAAVLRVKLGHLEEWNAARRERADRYDQLFLAAGLADRRKLYPDEQHPVVVPYRAEGRKHVFHQYVIRARARDALQRFLADAGVGTDVYYPLPLHLQTCFRGWGGRPGDCPEAERAAAEVLALPIYPELTPEQQQYVAAKVSEFYRHA
jgi:dTDP-4-amino-4,6-dideoxygalactose transaminase